MSKKHKKKPNNSLKNEPNVDETLENSTENEALEDAIKYLKGLEDIYIWIKEREIKNGKI